MDLEKQVILLNFLKMIKNRNIELNNEYKIKNIKKKFLTKEYVNRFFGEELIVLDIKKKIYLKFLDKKVGVKEIKLKILDKLNDEEYETIIIITKCKLNSYVINKLNALNKSIEIFSYNTFYINLIDHFLVPKHQILDKKHEELIKKKFNSKLPSIKKNDPICRYYNCKVGQVLKINRKNEIYYRMVSN